MKRISADKPATSRLWTLLTIGVLAMATAARAGQGFEIPWHTIDGGGAVVVGGTYELIGTIGQPDASTPLVGGGWSLVGGFWAADTFGGLIGDMNCDGALSVGDINPFVLALTDPAAYAAIFPDCDLLNGDCTGDGTLTVGDINCFVDLLTGG